MNIEELSKRSQLWGEINKINDQIQKLELEGYNYTGKFIHYEPYGYMYVKRQNTSTIGTSKFMSLYGFAFKDCSFEYRDDFYVNTDADDSWDIPINIFLNDVKENKIEIITEEEFKKKLNYLLVKFSAEWEIMLNKIKNEDN